MNIGNPKVVGAQSTVAAATVPDPGAEAGGSEAHVFITIEMTRPDGVKVRKMLGGRKVNNACDEIQYPPENYRLHLRRDLPREMSDDERALHAMCVSGLELVSAKLLP